jgi:hypothetical protein
MSGCLELALAETLERIRIVVGPAVSAPHRIPLGLLLLSRQQLTAEQLRTALEAQRAAGHGRIGEWLQRLGFATEDQITAALARQWSCPVLRMSTPSPASNLMPAIPSLLLRSFSMIPVNFVAATSTLHIAFGEGIDYGVLYAIEQMLACRTEPCLVSPSLMRKNLLTLSPHRGKSEVVFERVADAAEFVRIVGSYACKMDASEIRVVPCGVYIWVRLEHPAREAVNLLLGAPSDPGPTLFASPVSTLLPAS